MVKQVPKDDKSPVALLPAKEQWNAIAKDVLPLSGPTEVHWVKPKKVHGKFFLFFGVILPLIAMTLELWTHTLARYYFDPFPSAYHVLLFTLIPLANLMAYLSGRMDLTRHYATMALLSGMAMGIGVLYTLMFLSVTPTMCLAILACGIGLLGLAPLLSLPCTWFAGKTVCAFAHKQRAYFDAHQVEHIGHLIVLVMVIAVELPSTLTRVHLAEATEHSKSAEAIGWLRKYGNQEVMLRACYERSGRATDVLGTLYEHAHPISVEQARQVFYQVTGKAFNSVPIPASARSTIQKTGMVSDIAGVNATVQDEFDLDADIAGEAVSGIARGLAAKGSSLSGTIDNDAAIAKMDWTISLQNSSKYDREARAKLLLPPGAVLTAAKIRINDQEREATIMTRSVARAIYTQNIIQKKDPLLVSNAGVDRVLVQCFPVRPSSSADITLTIVAPLEISSSGKAFLELPAFEERNFVVDGPIGIDLESTLPIICTAVSKAAGTPIPNSNSIKGTIDSMQLSRFNGVVAADRDPNCHRVWCHDKFTGNAYVAERTLQPQSFPLPKTLYVVLDGSEAMEPYRQQIIVGLKSIKADFKVQLKVVDDDINVLCDLTQSSDPNFSRAVEKLSSMKFQGGQNDDIALKDALEQAQKSDGAVLWLHACQPMSSMVGTTINQCLNAAGNEPLLYDLQIASGPNELLSGVDTASVIRVARTGDLVNDMNRLLNESMKIKDEPNRPSQYLHHLGDEPSEPGYKVDTAELAQIRAFDQVIRDNRQGHATMAAQTAMQYHLVTPLTSAIVNVPLVNTDNLIEPPPPPTQDSNPFENKDTLRALGGIGSAIGYVVSGQYFSNAISSAFSSTISQLNNLSAAAGTAGPSYRGSFGGDYTYGRPGSAGSGLLFGGSPNDYANAPRDAEQNKNQVTLRERVSPSGSFGDAYSSQGDTSVHQYSVPYNFANETSPGVCYMQPNLNYDVPKSAARKANTKQYNPGQYPMLQGATNGTVGSIGGADATVVDAREGVCTQGLIPKNNEQLQGFMKTAPDSSVVTGFAPATEIAQEHAKKLSALKEDSPSDESRTGDKWDIRPNYFLRYPVGKLEVIKEEPSEKAQAILGGNTMRMEGNPVPVNGRGVLGANSIGSRSHGFLDATTIAIKLPLFILLAALYPFVLIFVKNRTKGNYKPQR